MCVFAHFVCGSFASMSVCMHTVHAVHTVRTCVLQCSLSKPITLGTKEKVQIREVLYVQ